MTKNKAGKIIASLGFITLVYDFIHMYSLVGDCPNGSAGCSAYSNWKIFIFFGIALFLAGIVLMILDRKKF
jgi:hypothetical protein